ncbi:MAG: hypothetical protein HYZ22_09005 [Chloroflexi bacterium]|nr:hypothetical protein [Chloroflexota bacterium]
MEEKKYPTKKYWIYDLQLLIKINLIFYFAFVLLIFFEEDITRLFTPFILPFLCIGFPVIYFLLVIVSIVHILPQTEDMTWESYSPLLINLAAICTVIFLYKPLGDFRINAGFQIKEKRFDQAAHWIIKSIENGDINLDNDWIVDLPKEYRGLAEDERVFIAHNNGIISIQFYRGGGMFEYSPSYVYRSDNITPPFEDFADTVCVRRLLPYWYDCY